MIICPEGHPNPNGTTYCATCKKYIDATATVEPTVVPGELQPLASLSPPSLSVPAGGEASCDVLVESRAITPERYDIEVTGDAAAFALVDSKSLEVAPGTVAAARLTFRFPSGSPDAELQFVVRVVPSERPEAPGLVSGHIQVQAQSPATTVLPSVQLRPETSQGRTVGKHVLIVNNRGTDPVTSEPAALASDDSVEVAFDPPSVAVPAGGTAAIQLRVRPQNSVWLGQRRHAFRVLAGPGAQVDGMMIQKARLPIWLALAPLLVVVIAAIALSGGDGGGGIVGVVKLQDDPNLHVRTGPSSEGEPVGDVQNGDEVTVACQEPGPWFRLIKPQQFEGNFVFGDLVQVNENPPPC